MAKGWVAVFLEIATNLPPYGWQISAFEMKRLLPLKRITFTVFYNTVKDIKSKTLKKFTGKNQNFTI